MNENHSYTLAELADQTGLTERTVRYYIERVLPPNHKQGRGKLARYGQDTLNCIRFILLARERHGIKPGQAKGVLADVPQETIDRVVRGEEELAVMTVPSGPMRVEPERAMLRRSASSRMKNYVVEESRSPEPRPATKDSLESISDWEMSEPMPDMKLRTLSASSPPEPRIRWRTVFADEQLRIQCRGKHKLTPHQEEQIKTAAKLIELALK